MSRALFLAVLLAVVTSLSTAWARIDIAGGFDSYDAEKYQKLTEEAQSRLQQAQRAYNETRASYDDIVARESRLRNDFESAAQQIERNRLRSLDLSTQRAQNDQRRQQLSRELEEIRRSLPALQQAVNTARTEVDHLSAAWNAQKVKIEAAEARRRDLSQVAVARERDAANVQVQVQGLQNEVQRLQGRKQNAISRRQSAETKLGRLNGEISSAESRISAAQGEMAKLQQERPALQSKRTTLDGQIKVLNDQIREADKKKDKATAARLRSQRQEVETQVSMIAEQLRQLDHTVSGLQKEIADLEHKIPKLRSETASAHAEVSQANTETGQTESQIQSRTQALNAAEQEFNRLNQLAQQARQAVAAQGAVVQQAKDGFQPIDSRFQNAQRLLAEAQSAYNQKSQMVDTAAREIARMEDLKRKLAEELAEIARTDSNLRVEVQRLRTELDRSAQLRQSAQRRLSDADEEVRRADRWLAETVQAVREVQTNIANAQREIGTQGTADGSNDGLREGTEKGVADGQGRGVREGAGRGQSEGSVEGRRMSYEQGYAQGGPEGTRLGQELALSDAEINGKRDGRAEGLKDGLAQAYQAGFERGKSRADDETGYKQGLVDGNMAGLKQAQADAKTSERQGYTEKEKEFRSTELKEIDGGLPIAQHFTGIQQGNSGPGDGRYYNPRPANYPHPRLRRFYLEAYDFSYRDSLVNAYRASEARAFQDAYSVSYEQARGDSASRTYPEERDRGFAEARAKFQKETYDQIYPGEYAQRKQGYYEPVRSEAAQDESAVNRGAVEGNFKASFDKGFEKTRVEGYKNNIENERQLAYRRGADAATERYTRHAVLEVVSVKLVESIPDGVATPGEWLSVDFTMKNYGLREKEGLISKVKQNRTALPTLPPRSLVNFHGVGRVQVDQDAIPGSTLVIPFQLIDGTEVVYTKNLGIKVGEIADGDSEGGSGQ